MDREKLINAGVDYDEGVGRFGGRPELYEKYLRKFFYSGYMQAIERQLESGDIPGAFRTTHDLKGAAGNLSLNRFYAAVCELTELLRAGDAGAGRSDAFLRAKAWYDSAAAALREAEQ